MSTSLVAHFSRSGEVHIVDRDAIPHTVDLHPIMEIAVAVLNAGYAGLAIDELKLSNGRYAHALDVDLATPEGQLFQELSRLADSGEGLPNVPAVLDALELAYQSLTKVGSAA